MAERGRWAGRRRATVAALLRGRMLDLLWTLDRLEPPCPSRRPSSRHFRALMRGRLFTSSCLIRMHFARQSRCWPCTLRDRLSSASPPSCSLPRRRLPFYARVQCSLLPASPQIRPAHPSARHISARRHRRPAVGGAAPNPTQSRRDQLARAFYPLHSDTCLSGHRYAHHQTCSYSIPKFSHAF